MCQGTSAQKNHQSSKRRGKRKPSTHCSVGLIYQKNHEEEQDCGRPAKRLRYTFDDEDQEKLEKLERSVAQAKNEPEMIEPGVVENRRQLKLEKSLITSRKYLESKVTKVVKDDLRRKIIELLLHLHIVLHLQ